MMRRVRTAMLLVLLSVVPPALTPLYAHDFWIEPSNFFPKEDSLLTARLFVGQAFDGDPLPRDESHISRFVLSGVSGESSMLGAQGRDPAGIVRVGSPGLYLIGYESTPSSVDLDAAKLQKYIQDEGLEPFFHGDPNRPVEDRFSRCAKSLIVAGRVNTPSVGFDRRLGQTLELVPESNPAALLRGGSLPVKLLQSGKPLAGALIVAVARNNPANRLGARSDAKGRVRFTFPDVGVWLLKAVWVRPASGRTDVIESYWASLTFEVPAISIEK